MWDDTTRMRHGMRKTDVRFGFSSLKNIEYDHTHQLCIQKTKFCNTVFSILSNIFNLILMSKKCRTRINQFYHFQSITKKWLKYLDSCIIDCVASLYQLLCLFSCWSIESIVVFRFFICHDHTSWPSCVVRLDAIGVCLLNNWRSSNVSTSY